MPSAIPLDAFFGRLQARLPPSLAAPFGLCRRLATAFRGDVMAVFELPLRTASPGLDFSVRLEQLGQCRDAAAAALPAAARELLAAREAGEFTAAFLPSVWLEYDLRRGERVLPISCFRVSEAPSEWVAGQLLPLVGASLPAAALAELVAAFATLPAAARPLYLFDLAARGRPGLRLELAAEPRVVAGWLAGLGATAQAEVLEQLAAFWGDGDRPHVSVDFDGAWAPRVGLENSFRGQPPGEARWRAKLEQWAAAGLCSRDEVELLLAWPAVETPGAADWPRGSDERPLPGWLITCLSHLKLAQAPGGELEIKAYLLFQYLARETRSWPSR